MTGTIKNVVVVATPTAPLLRHVLHSLAHTDLVTTLITRETSIEFSSQSHDSHNHHDSHSVNGHQHHSSPLTHKKSDFSESAIASLLKGQDVLITILTGTDVHLTSRLIEAASSPESSISRFLPSEYALDTSNAAIRALLPPYQTRWAFQEQLRAQSKLEWTAIYAGSALEEAMKPDSVLGIDVLWGSVSAFEGRESGGTQKVVLTTYADVADAIVTVATLPSEQFKDINARGTYVSSFITDLEELVKIVEKVEDMDREYDWYEAVGKLMRKEADERMKLGFFDGGVALLTRVAVWDPEIDAMRGWEKEGEKWKSLKGKKSEVNLEDVLKTVVEAVKSGKDDADCGC